MRKKVKPGDKRNISFPLDIRKDFLDFLNSQSNFSGALVKLALEGFESFKIDELEKRIKELEEKVNDNEKLLQNNEVLKNDEVVKNDSKEKEGCNIDVSSIPSLINPEEEDDEF